MLPVLQEQGKHFAAFAPPVRPGRRSHTFVEEEIGRDWAKKQANGCTGNSGMDREEEDFAFNV
jgi:hypothetical protein